MLRKIHMTRCAIAAALFWMIPGLILDRKWARDAVLPYAGEWAYRDDKDD